MSNCYKFESALDDMKKMALNSCVMHKHCACLFQGDKVLAQGVNKHFRIKPLDNKSKYLAIHAEVDALSSVKKKLLKGADILVIRVGSKSNLCNSRPCNSCIEKLQQKGIRKAYYSNSKGDIVCEFVDNMPKIHESSGHKARMRS